MNKLFVFLMFFLPFFFLCADEFYFNSTTDGVTTEELWNITFTENGFSLYAGGPDKQVEMDGRSDADGHGITITYRVPEENNRYITAEHDGSKLILSGVNKNGRTFSRNVQLNAPWFSSFYIMPLHFINSNETQIDFSILEPLRNSVLKLRAVKEQEEILLIEGKTIDTVKVCITLPNIFGAFWRSFFWYRKSDGVFVKSEETRGFPGTSRTYMIIKNL